MMELLEPSQPDKEEYDKEEERPDDLNEQSTPVTFSQGQILPEEQLELQEESHLVAILVSLAILQIWSPHSSFPLFLALSQFLPLVVHHRNI